MRAGTLLRSWMRIPDIVDEEHAAKLFSARKKSRAQSSTEVVEVKDSEDDEDDDHHSDKTATPTPSTSTSRKSSKTPSQPGASSKAIAKGMSILCSQDTH